MHKSLTSFLAAAQVRAAATLGGNLVLTRDLGLESDAATLLIAAGAEVQTAAPGSKPSWQTVESYVSQPSKANQGEVVVAIRLPPIKAGDRFWSFKVRRAAFCCVDTWVHTIALAYVTVECCQMGGNSSLHAARLSCCLRHRRVIGGRRCLMPWSCLQIAERHWNAHAFINIAALLNVDTNADKESCGIIKSANIVLGYPSMHEGALPSSTDYRIYIQHVPT